MHPIPLGAGPMTDYHNCRAGCSASRHRNRCSSSPIAVLESAQKGSVHPANKVPLKCVLLISWNSPVRGSAVPTGEADLTGLCCRLLCLPHPSPTSVSLGHLPSKWLTLKLTSKSALGVGVPNLFVGILQTCFLFPYTTCNKRVSFLYCTAWGTGFW